jgi:hypothetical protein
MPRSIFSSKARAPLGLGSGMVTGLRRGPGNLNFLVRLSVKFYRLRSDQLMA